MNLNTVGIICWSLCGLVVLFFLVSLFPLGTIIVFCMIVFFILGWVTTGKKIQEEQAAKDEFQRLQEENEQLKKELDKDDKDK
ncbi:hypothetical protein Goe25_02220 [Bacillus phage vB_BsuM-Goe25]|nr:hypothetical protein Goe25_02220 [Bacillus phage vB_BsuM-Goe25]